MKYEGVLICVTDTAFLLAGEGDGSPALPIPALAFKCFGSVPDARSDPLLSLNARTRFQLYELWSFPLLKKKKRQTKNQKRPLLYFIYLF